MKTSPLFFLDLGYLTFRCHAVIYGRFWILTVVNVPSLVVHGSLIQHFTQHWNKMTWDAFIWPFTAEDENALSRSRLQLPNFTVSLLKLLLPSKLFLPLKTIISVFLVTLSRNLLLKRYCSYSHHFGYSRMHNNFSTKENACYSCGCSRVQAWCHPELSNVVLRTGFVKMSRPHAAVVALWLLRHCSSVESCRCVRSEIWLCKFFDRVEVCCFVWQWDLTVQVFRIFQRSTTWTWKFEVYCFSHHCREQRGRYWTLSMNNKIIHLPSFEHSHRQVPEVPSWLQFAIVFIYYYSNIFFVVVKFHILDNLIITNNF